MTFWEERGRGRGKGKCRGREVGKEPHVLFWGRKEVEAECRASEACCGRQDGSCCRALGGGGRGQLSASPP